MSDAKPVILCQCGKVLESPADYAAHAAEFPDHFTKTTDPKGKRMTAEELAAEIERLDAWAKTVPAGFIDRAEAHHEMMRIVYANFDTVLAALRSCAALEAQIATLREERDAAMPWALFYGKGLSIKEIAEQLGGGLYDYSPWLYAPLMRDGPRAEAIKALTDQVAALTRPHSDEEVEKIAGALEAGGTKIGREAAQHIRRLSLQLSEARGALEPFAAFGGPHSDMVRAYPDLEGDTLLYSNSGKHVTVADVRRARSAIRALKSSDETKK